MRFSSYLSSVIPSLFLPALFFPALAFADTEAAPALDDSVGEGGSDLVQNSTDLLTHPAAIFALIVFGFAYILVLLEEKIDLRKSKPMIIAAGLVWALVAWVVHDSGIDPEDLHNAVSSAIQDYGSLFLFLLVAMTYVGALRERQVFDALRSRLVRYGLSFRAVFWITGLLAFFLSAVADNMTTALVTGAIVMAVARDDPKFLTLGFINIVVAANAGGVFCPFGDVTSLMVWQSGKIEFFDFFSLFLPALAGFLVPALLLSLAVPSERPEPEAVDVPMKVGAKRVMALGLLTIVFAVVFEQILGLPAFLGMMLGLGLLFVFGHHLRQESKLREDDFDMFTLMNDTEWDTMLYFFGVIFCISGIAYLGYLDVVSAHVYEAIGPSLSNILIGGVSSVVDNIPLMFSVLSMNPDMNEHQWLLLTLALGTGGSLLSIGSAAGISLMGLSRGRYTFLGHLRWTPVILLGYGAALLTHFLLIGFE